MKIHLHLGEEKRDYLTLDTGFKSRQKTHCLMVRFSAAEIQGVAKWKEEWDWYFRG